MFLKRLILKNVRSIKQFELPFDTPNGKTRKWTLLLGENGCGKSTVLRSIALLLAGSEALTELLGNPDDWIRIGSTQCSMHADLVTADGEERHIDLTLRRGEHIRDVFRRNEETLDLLDRALQHSNRSYLSIGYGVSRRLNSTITPYTGMSEVFRHPRAQSVATLFLPDATLNPLETWAIDLDYRRRDEGLAVVRNGLAGLLPDVSFDHIDREKKQLLFKTPDGLVPLSHLSDGYQNVAGWGGDLLYRITTTFEDYRNPLKARGLLLIDEIDLHLHPLWKRQLVEFINDKLPNFQIVATTHSAVTAHQAGEGELFVLRREQPTSPPTLYQYPGAPRNLMLHQVLLSPIIGLSTIDSRQVEEMRAEYRQLQAKSTTQRSSAENQRLARLRDELEDLPDWTVETPQDRQQRELLVDIQQALRNTP